MTQKALLQGAGDGTAVPAGYVGQVIQAAPASAVTLAATSNWKSLCSITLTPGNWLLSGTSVLNVTGGTFTRVGCGLSTLSNDSDTNGNSAVCVLNQSNTGGNIWVNAGPRYLSVSSNQTVHLLGYLTYSVSGTMDWLATSNIQAIRIA